MTAAPGPVVVDLQAAQSRNHGERGIARYCTDLVRALAARHPGLINTVLVDPDRPVPAAIAELDVRVGPAPDWSAAEVFHVMSPFELDVPVARLWPREASRRGLRLAVTLFDMIPEVLPDIYLQDAGSRRRYQARKLLLRAADAVLAISPAVAADGMRLLRLESERFRVVGAAPAATFVPPRDRGAAAAAASGAVEGLGPRYVLYTGGVDERKNVDRLLEAWALLPVEVRGRWQLVVVCKLAPLERNHLEVRRDALQLGDRVVFTGYVPDEVLLLLYQGTDLVVFPALYEGYGLPVAEGMACGAPAIASATSSLVDLVAASAGFDPWDPAAIAVAVERALTDQAHRGELLAWSARPGDDWHAVADRVAAVYRELTGRRGRPLRRPRPRAALVSPMPPTPTPGADLGAALLDAVTGPGGVDVDVDVFVDGDTDERRARAASRHPACDAYRAGALRALDRLQVGYDLTVLTLGDRSLASGEGTDPGGPHAGAWAAAGSADMDEPVVVVWDDLAASPEAARIAASARRVLVPSEEAAAAARAAIAPEYAGRIEVWPGVHPPVAERDGGDVDPGLVCAFGFAADDEATADDEAAARLVEAFFLLAVRRPELRLVLVGAASVPGAVVERLGVADRVAVSGPLGRRGRRPWLERVAVAVVRGEPARTPPALLEAMSAGVPAVVLGGVSAGLSGVVPAVGLRDGAGPLAATVGALVDDRDERDRAVAAALAHAAAHGIAPLAGELLQLVETGADRPHRPR